MKKITQQQCDAILAEMERLNVPFQSYKSIAQLFASLPAVKEVKEEANTKSTEATSA